MPEDRQKKPGKRKATIEKKPATAGRFHTNAHEDQRCALPARGPVGRGAWERKPTEFLVEPERAMKAPKKNEGKIRVGEARV